MTGEVDTLIISDVHLGSEVCEAEKLLKTLKSYKFKRLILLGDIFDNLNFKKLSSPQWEVLSYINILAETPGIEFVWINGNHDGGITNVMPNIIKAEIREEYTWWWNGRRCLAIHGDQFDDFLKRHRLISDFATAVYQSLQKLDPKNQRIPRLLKRYTKIYLRESKLVAEGAVKYARKKAVDVVFCGHTHNAMHKYFNKYLIDYYNTGCWTEATPTYITIDKHGILIHGYEE